MWFRCRRCQRFCRPQAGRWLPWAVVVALTAVVAGVAVWEVRRPAIVQESSAGQCAVLPIHRLGRHRSGRRDFAGREIRRVQSGPRRASRPLGQPGGHRAFSQSHPGVPPLGVPGINRTFGFSGDGSEIWFAEGGDASAPKWLIPLTGGTPRPFLSKGATAPSWSPDDTRLAYLTNGPGDPMSIADRTSADARPIVVDQRLFRQRPAQPQSGLVTGWPVDLLRARAGTDRRDERVARSTLWRHAGATDRVAGSRESPGANRPRTLLYVARAEDGSGPWLWSLDVETKVTRRVISGLEHYSSVSASRDGRRVVATVTNPTASLWRVPLLDRQAEDRDVQPYALPSVRALSPRFGGTSLFYLSAQGAGDGLWRFQDGNPSEVWTAADDSLSEPPAVSPDGSRVAIIVRQEGKQRLSIMSADGTNARTLAPSITIQGSGGQGSADWSPDGTWIVAAGGDGKGAGLFKIPVDGGGLCASSPVRRQSGLVAGWALIVYGGPVVGGQVPLLGVRPDGTRVELPEVRTGLGGGHRFLPNGTGLVYLPRAQTSDFWLLDLATNKTRPLTRLSDHGGYARSTSRPTENRSSSTVA